MRRLAFAVLLVFLLTGCVSRPAQNPAETHTLVQEGAYTLSDGTRVDSWITDVFQNTVYKTAEGWELLRIPAEVDIANVGVFNLEGFQHLNETAQEKILAYYDKNWPELDIQAILEDAWEDCNAEDAKKGMFSPWWAHQSVFPVAYNETIMCFALETTIAGSDNVARIQRISTIFQRESGEVIDPWDLFIAERDDAMDAVAELLAKGNKLQFEEFRKALEGENVIAPGQGYLEFFFPAGSLSWMEYDSYYSLNSKELAGLLHDWAVTERTE